jgi:hypothetical protein
MTEGGHDFLSDLNDPATLAASLTAQTLKGLPLAQALLGDQRLKGAQTRTWHVSCQSSSITAR